MILFLFILSALAATPKSDCERAVLKDAATLAERLESVADDPVLYSALELDAARVESELKALGLLGTLTPKPEVKASDASEDQTDFEISDHSGDSSGKEFNHALETLEALLPYLGKGSNETLITTLIVKLGSSDDKVAPLVRGLDYVRKNLDRFKVHFAFKEYLTDSKINLFGFEPPGKSLSGPLTFAVRNRYFDTAAALLEAGSRPDEYWSERNPLTDFTPLYYAVTENHTATVKLLLEKGAQVNLQYKPAQPDWALCLKPPLFAINGLTYSGKTHTTAPEILQLLVDYGADLGIKDEAGMTPLFRVVTPEQLTILLKAKNSDLNHKDNRQNTALHYFASRTHPDLVLAALDAGAKSVRNSSGFTPFDVLSTLLQKQEDELKAQGTFERLQNVVLPRLKMESGSSQ